MSESTELEFVERIKKLHDDLMEEVVKLTGFVGTEKFNKLIPEERSLLLLQLRQMKPYLATLKARLEFCGYYDEVSDETEESEDDSNPTE